MSLHTAAKHLETKGRNGDSMLVHMTPGEVQSLQKLAMAGGGSLTVNPATGLAEAGFLKNMLPMIAGIGLSMIPGVGPLAAAGMVGGFETVRTGDIGKGLMAGLGAYGGAGIGQGLASAGSSGVMEAAQQNALNAGQAVGTEAATAINPSVYTGDLAGFTPDQVSQITAQRSAVMATPGIESAGQTTFGNMGRGIGSLGTETGRSLAYQAMPTGTLPALATTAAAGMTPEQKVPEVKEEPSSGKYISKDFRAYVPATPNPYYRPQGLGYTGYAAEGGVMPDDLSYAVGGMVDPMQRMPNGGLAAIQGMRDGYGATQTADGNIPQFNEGGKLQMKRMKLGDGIFKDTNPNTANLGAAEAAEYYVRNAAKRSKVPYTKMPKTNIEDLGEINVGIAKAAAGGSIGGYSDGGRMLKGPGDGMSDSIPGVIGKRQPARLADGEFVVPADVVSHLGNGSTDAGAKRLYAMMDKVRHARTGNKKQGKKIKPEKYMPA
jgi:hypothetical protein